MALSVAYLLMMSKKEFDAVAKIMIVFLGTLLFFTVMNGGMSIFMLIGALCVTYIFVHLWEKRYLKSKK